MTCAPAGTEHHPHARAVLGAALAAGGRPSHAYLFHGPAGVGKRTAARAFAAALLCEGAPDPDSARARVASGAHPDLTWVAPSGAHDMLVSDIDEAVVGAAARTPFEALRRVFVIERADTLNDESANRMLKTLEEPAPFVHLVLLTDGLAEVLPTIVSRCQLVRFDALGAQEIAARLEREGVGGEVAQACARLALGDAQLARGLACDDGPKLRAAAERFARAALRGEMAGAPWSDLLALARQRGAEAIADLEAQLADELETLSRREKRRVQTDYAERGRRARRRAETGVYDIALALAGLWYRDVACLAWGAPELACHRDRLPELERDAAGRDPQRLRAALELVEESRLRLRFNVSEELALEALGYRLEQLLLAEPASIA